MIIEETRLINLTNLQDGISSHECESKYNSHCVHSFCDSCGKSISHQLTAFGTKKRFLRSTRFEIMTGNYCDSHLILQNMIKKQCVNRIYRDSLNSNKHLRCEMFNFAWSFCKYFKYSLQTYFLSIAYIDVVVSRYSIADSQIRVCVYACVLLAAKLEENLDKIPLLKDSVRNFEDKYDEKVFSHYENVVFQCLDWNLNVQTPFSFLHFFLSKGVLTEDEVLLVIQQHQIEAFMRSFDQIVLVFLEIALQQYKFNRFSSQVVAISVIVCTRVCLKLRSWTEELRNLTLLEWVDVEDCISMLLSETKSANIELYTQFENSLIQFERFILKNKKMQKSSALQKRKSKVQESPIEDEFCEKSTTETKRTRDRKKSKTFTDSDEFFEPEKNEKLKMVFNQIQDKQIFNEDDFDEIVMGPIANKENWKTENPKNGAKTKRSVFILNSY